MRIVYWVTDSAVTPAQAGVHVLGLDTGLRRYDKIFCILSIVFFLLLSSLPTHAAPNNTSGLALPRFVSLKSEEVNVRTGPGTRYPISWVYHREGLPVEIIEEYDLWRKIRDAEGTTGWVHKTMVEGKRNALITGKVARVIRSEPGPRGRPLLKAEPQVIARLVECEKDWCRIQVSGRKGWIEKKYLWGVYPEEVID